MTNNNSYDKIIVTNKQKLNKVEMGLECSVNLDTNEQIDKILAVNLETTAIVCEALSKEASVNGNVIVSLVYLSVDGKIYNTSYTTPYMTKFVDNLINPNSKVFAKVTKTFGKVESLNENVAKVVCALEVDGYMYNDEEVSYLEKVDEDVCVKYEEIQYKSLAGNLTNNFTETFDVEIKENIKQVLFSSCNLTLKSYVPQNNFVTLCGELESKITYLTESETPELRTVVSKQEIKQDIECDFCNAECLVDAEANVNHTEQKNTVIESDGNVKVNMEVPITANLVVFKKNNLSIISDLYSTKNLTYTTQSSYSSIDICDPIYFEKKIEGSLVLGENEPRIDKLLAVNYSKSVVTNYSLDNGEISVSGVIQSNLIYFNEDDAKVNSVDVEVPFVVSVGCDYEGDHILDVDAKVCDVDVMVKKGKDVYVDATLKVLVKVCSSAFGTVLSDVEYTEPVPSKNCAIEIYFAKQGENVWDIGKKLFISPETIYKQNPEIQEVLQNDTKLSLYYKK